MNRPRMFGSDTPFCAWLRRQQEELPSYSETCGFVASDNDVHIHCYMTEIDSRGTREIQALMFLEIKTRGGRVHDSQRDTLVKLHACLAKGNIVFSGQTIRHFGVSFIFLSGMDPDDSETIYWGRFDQSKPFSRVIRGKKITKEQLLKLLRFELHPDNLAPRPFRRHHKTRQIVELVKTPLGFVCEEIITKRS